MTSESGDLLRGETSISRSGSRLRCRGNTTVCVSVLVVLMFAVAVLSVLAAGPLHALCSVTWNITFPCTRVSSLLVNQIDGWTTDTCPVGSHKCLYSLVSVDSNSISATHTTPVLRFVDDITFTFSHAASDNCVVQGHSASRSWYAILDSGTNYLNMYNVLEGSGLTSSPGFREFTSDRICTQYSTAKQLLNP